MVFDARRSGLAVLALALGAAGLIGSAPAGAAAASSSRVYVIQGVPKQQYDISVDGEEVGSDVGAKGIVGPLELTAGRHQIEFTGADGAIGQSFDVSKASVDVVLHWPADEANQPQVTVFDNDMSPVAAGKGRLIVAHTAVVPPADIVANGKVLFSNIANGEFVTADVPGDTYEVSVVPTGQTTDPLLGPLDLKVEAGSLTRVFAIGEPRNGSMDAVVQVLPLGSAGSPAPGSVDAGEAGLVATNRATPDHSAWLVLVAGLGGGSVLGLAAVTRRRRHVRA